MWIDLSFQSSVISVGVIFFRTYAADVQKDVMCGEIRFLMGERIPTVDGQFLHVRLNRMNPVLFRFYSAFRDMSYVAAMAVEG